MFIFILLTSIAELAYILVLKNKIKILYKCPSFGCYTRQAISDVWKGVERRNNYVIFFDLDGIHDLNSKISYEGVNAKIKKVCDQFPNQIARWLSGDEFVLVCSAFDLGGLLERIERAFFEEGMTLTFAVEPLKGKTFDEAVKIASDRVLKQKAIKNSQKG